MINWKSGNVQWNRGLLKTELCEGCGSSLKITGERSKQDQVYLFEHVHASGLPNYQCCRIPVSDGTLNISVWYEKLKGYRDRVVCDLLHYGFPIDFDRSKTVSSSAGRNHKGARDFPQFIHDYFEKECTANRIAGPFQENSLSIQLAVSVGASVNDGISKDIYLGEDIDLHYASVEQVCNMVNEIGPGALIYKRDLRHAYRQIPVDPRDYCYLGYY